ncbi:MAG: TolC family protein [Prevotellaceae bacterium]|jgi:outer membrane protein|nr:TolC family protein [Prevotellaceae bacterium]
MKRYLFIIILTLFLSSSAFSQKRWTLSECMLFAIQNNIGIKQQALIVENSEIELNTSRNNRLPNLSAGANQSINFGRSPSMATGIYEQNTSSGTSFSLSSSVPVYNGKRISNEIKNSEINLKAAIEGLNKAKENLSLNVAAFYLEALFKKEILKVCVEQNALTNKQVKRTDIMVQEGKAPVSQLYDIKAQLAKEETNLVNAQNDLAQSLLNLAQLLNINDPSDFDVLEPENIESVNISMIQNPELVYEAALEQKPLIKEAAFRLQSSEVGVQITRSLYLPSISLGASYSNGFNYLFGKDITNMSVSNQLSNNPREAIGLNINIPIFSRFQTRNQVRSARLNVENRTLELENVKLLLQKEIQQAYLSAVAAQARYLSTQKSLDTTLEAYKYADERYNLQIISVYEFGEAQTKLFSSKSELVQAKYDFLFRTKILDFYRGVEIEL